MKLYLQHIRIEFLLLIFSSFSILSRRQLKLVGAVFTDQDYAIYGEFNSNQPKCANTISVNNNIRCFGFTTWPQLIATVNDTNRADIAAEITELDMRPSEAIVLTGELDVQQVCEIFCKKNPNNSDACENTLQVYVAGVKGVDVANKWKPISSSYFYMSLLHVSGVVSQRARARTGRE
jgi:hypothetical protein